MGTTAVRFLRDRSLTELKKNIEKHLPLYRKGNFSYLETDPSQTFTGPVHLDDLAIAQIKVRKPKDELYDAENCETLYNGLRKITPYVATDERMWAFLTHTALLPYSRARWPIPADDRAALKHIATHFFAPTQRQLERDNAASRLWWIGHLCSRVEGLTLRKALAVFLYKSDVRANILERPTTAQSNSIFSEILTLLAKSYDRDKKMFERAQFRRAMVRLNGYGGYRLIDVMDNTALQKLLTQFATDPPVK